MDLEREFRRIHFAELTQVAEGERGDTTHTVNNTASHAPPKFLESLSSIAMGYSWLAKKKGGQFSSNVFMQMGS